MNAVRLLALSIAYVPFLSGTGHDGIATGNRRAAAMDLLPVHVDGFFYSGGVRIRYVEAGQGPPVVLIHGYIANADRHWVQTGVFANLAADHRVIALDCRGHGQSDEPTEPDAYGLEMAHDVLRLLDHLTIRRAHVVGF